MKHTTLWINTKNGDNIDIPFKTLSITVFSVTKIKPRLMCNLDKNGRISVLLEDVYEVMVLDKGKNNTNTQMPITPYFEMHKFMPPQNKVQQVAFDEYLKVVDGIMIVPKNAIVKKTDGGYYYRDDGDIQE